MTSITIPNSVTSIGYYAFNGCSGLTSVTIGGGVTSMSSYVFSHCDNIKELIYAEGCTNALPTYLKSITSVKLPNSVTSIGDYAFSGCKGLTSIDIPESINSIGSYAFSGCKGLTSISSFGDMPATIVFGAFRDINKQVCTLHVPQGTANAYRAAMGWKDFSLIVEDAVPGSTAVVGITAENEASKAIYNTLGRKLSAPQRGINIINNKKVFVR